jgi:hypothetical protein
MPEEKRLLTMSDQPSDHDRHLLSRLNALKQSTVDLDKKQCEFPQIPGRGIHTFEA